MKGGRECQKEFSNKQKNLWKHPKNIFGERVECVSVGRCRFEEYLIEVPLKLGYNTTKSHHFDFTLTLSTFIGRLDKSKPFEINRRLSSVLW